MGQFSDIGVAGTIGDADALSPAQLTFQTIRIGALMRLFLPTHTKFRFLGTVGAGMLLERLDWQLEEPNENPLYQSIDAFRPGGFGHVDLGFAFEITNVMFEIGVQHTIQSTKHLDVDDGDRSVNVFGSEPVLIAGPVLRVGYGLW